MRAHTGSGRAFLHLCILLAVILIWLVLGAISDADAAQPCRVQTHRFGPTRTIDDNTLEGLERSTRIGARAEGDLVPLTDGFVLYHERRWEQGTDGFGVPWETDMGYADLLLTSAHHQRVPLLGEVLHYASVFDTKIVFELHQWNEAWTPERLAEVVAAVKDRGVMDQVWFVGTIPAMTALAAIAPEATTVWRVDARQTPTPEFIANRSIEVMQVPHSTDRAEVKTWRSWGLKVEGRRIDREHWKQALRLGLRSIQTDEPLRWLRYCRRQS